MGERRGKDSGPTSDEVIAEADRLAGASGPKRTKGGFGNYGPVELMEAHRSLRAGRKTPPLPFEEAPTGSKTAPLPFEEAPRP